MPQLHHDADKIEHGTANAHEQRVQPNEPLDDEEKILAGRPDVNMPALLTRDVPGG
jgi:hypothetical protein